MPDIAYKLRQDFGLTPVIATEIEFYLHGVDKHYHRQQVLDVLWQECGKAGIALASCEQERGPNQYEIALQYGLESAPIAADTERFKCLLPGVFSGKDIQVDFSAKPLPNAPGSGLHVHLHLEDAARKNVFFREDDDFSPHLLQAIGGMLMLMNPCMAIFAPTEASYKRFAAKSNAPTRVSWGTNNRTVAIRLPTKPLNNKHIEHRVAGADANVEFVTQAILAGVYYGLKHECDPGEPIYGDASLPQYKLPLLAQTLSEAETFMHTCSELKTLLPQFFT